MQTEAEKYLIKILKKLLTLKKGMVNMINLGAAKSVVIEEDLKKSGHKFICDRSDIDNCQVNKPYVKHCYNCSLENMKPIKSNSYALAFANFVMEHILDIKKMAKETSRIIEKEGSLIISLPNPQAPEFVVAKKTSTKFHQLFRKKGHDEAYPVNYAYKSIDNFIAIMEKNNWRLLEQKYFPATYSYLHRFPIIKSLSHAYDRMANYFQAQRLLGHVVLHFENIKD